MNRPSSSSAARPVRPSTSSGNERWVSLGLALVLALAALVASPVARPVPAAAATTTLTNLAHLDFLLDDVSPKAVAGHTTHRLAQEPDLVVPQTPEDGTNSRRVCPECGGTGDLRGGAGRFADTRVMPA